MSNVLKTENVSLHRRIDIFQLVDMTVHTVGIYMNQLKNCVLGAHDWL